jgi:integrase
MREMQIPRKLRFEILKRDGFRCIYCGRQPPDVRLHVDHKIPVYDGGPTQRNNLVTSCEQCNGGKANIPLNVADSGKKQIFDLPHVTHRSKKFSWKCARFSIFTRSIATDASWYFQFESGGSRYKQSLHTTDPIVAVERAKLLLEADLKHLTDKMRAVLNGGVVTGGFGAGGCSRIEDVLAWLEKRPRPCANEASALKLVLRKLFSTPDKLTTAVFSADLPRRWKLMYEELCAGKTQNDANRIMRSANSILHQAKTVFSVERLSDMKAAGFVFPEMKVFFDEVKARRFKKLPKKTFVPVPHTVVARTLAEWKKLPRNEFLGVGLMLSCGLRKSQVAQVRWDWIGEEEHRPVLTGAAEVKNRKGRVHVFPITPFWRVLLRRAKQEKWIGDSAEAKKDYVLTGNSTERCDEVFRRISTWMRGLGWQMQKTNHAFRDYAGSLVAMKYGLEAAKEFLDHSSVTTTESHYTSFIKSHATRGRSYINWA